MCQMYLDKLVFMSQSSSYHDKMYPNHVCKLFKLIYDLKQTPRAWFHRLCTYVVSIDFKESIFYQSLFIYLQDGITTYFLVYDDIILTSSSSSFTTVVITKQGVEFSIKGLGVLKYFLGIYMTRLQDGSLFLSQQY